MKCPKCGYENDEGDQFCIKCGTSLSNRVQPKKKSKLPIIIIIIALIIAGAGGGYYFLHKDTKSTKDYPTLIAEADEYLQNEDYEQAIATYLEAIEIEPKEVKPYIQLADIYVIQEDYPSAVDILDKAKENIGDDNEEINAKYEEVQQEYTQYQSTRVYSLYYEALTELESEKGTAQQVSRPTAISPKNIGYSGLFYARLLDMDNDGVEEMIACYCNQNEDSEHLVLYAYDSANDELIMNDYASDSSHTVGLFLNSNLHYLTKDGCYYLLAGYYDSFATYTYVGMNEDKELYNIVRVEIENLDDLNYTGKIDGETASSSEIHAIVDAYQEEEEIFISDYPTTLEYYTEPTGELAKVKAQLQQ